MPSEREYKVNGMTCGHCVASVREEVSGVEGVEAVDVDLASGRMVVTGEAVSEDEIRAAVAEAGCELAAQSLSIRPVAARRVLRPGRTGRSGGRDPLGRRAQRAHRVEPSSQDGFRV